MTKILIVDDIEANLYVLRTILESSFQNIEIFEATCGLEALKIAIEVPFNLIILDVQMGDIDGFEVAKILKLKDSTKDIPIIFLTAIYKSDKFKELGFSLGAVDYLTKPIDDNQLLNRVSLYIQLFEKIEQEKELINRQKNQEALLLQQSKMASIGEMLQSISHQWNQPLNVIKIVGSTMKDMLNEKSISRSELLSNIDTILSQIDFMSNCMVDFKNFFSPSKELESFNIRDEINSTITIIQHRLLNSSIDLNLSICTNCNIIGYKNEFKHALLNILNNSIDAIISNREKLNLKPHQNRGFINIICECELNSKNLTLLISDSGGGCENIDKIFDKFYTTKGEKGSGIGLYITKRIIEERMGGVINVKNSDDGLEFRLIIKKDREVFRGY